MTAFMVLQNDCASRLCRWPTTGCLTDLRGANSHLPPALIWQQSSEVYNLDVLCSGTIFQDADGIERRCYPLLAFWIADRKAANALLNIKHHPAYYSDPWDLVHKDSLDQYDRTFEPRTAAAMKQVRL